MKIKIFIGILLGLIAGCTTTLARTEVSLYSKFQGFKEQVNKDYEEALKDNISIDLLDFYKQAEANMPPDIRFPFFKELASTIQVERSHFEIVQESTGCLTINGVDMDKEPKTLSLYYIQENSQWVIDTVHVHGHDSTQGYYTKVSCPIPG